MAEEQTPKGAAKRVCARQIELFSQRYATEAIPCNDRSVADKELPLTDKVVDALRKHICVDCRFDKHGYQSALGGLHLGPK